MSTRIMETKVTMRMQEATGTITLEFDDVLTVNQDEELYIENDRAIVRRIKYGIYDVQDNCWLGTSEEGTGPKTFDIKTLAKVASMIAAKRLGIPYTRLEVRPVYQGGAWSIKDELPTRMSTAKALRKLEDGL